VGLFTIFSLKITQKKTPFSHVKPPKNAIFRPKNVIFTSKPPQKSPFSPLKASLLRLCSQILNDTATASDTATFGDLIGMAECVFIGILCFFRVFMMKNGDFGRFYIGKWCFYMGKWCFLVILHRKMVIWGWTVF
jgi:hypothetical protein